MWPRTVEVMLACWLAVSPFIFRYSGDNPGMWWHDYTVAVLLAGLALVSFVHQTRRAHLLELVIAFWLMGYGWVTASGVYDGPRQNWICVGLLLLMTAIIPSDCVKPPYRWQLWNEAHGIGGKRPEEPYGVRM